MLDMGPSPQMHKVKKVHEDQRDSISVKAHVLHTTAQFDPWYHLLPLAFPYPVLKTPKHIDLVNVALYILRPLQAYAGLRNPTWENPLERENSDFIKYVLECLEFLK